MVSEVDQFESEVLQLAVRRVATPEGAEFYGLPIGSPITADVIAAKGGGAPKGALTPEKSGSGAKGKHMAGTIAGKANAQKTAPKPQAPKPLNLKAVKPTISGNNHFKVGKSSYSAPNGSKLIRPANQPGLAYVVTKDGKVHAFTEAGEVPIPKTLEAVYKAKFNDAFEGDENYSVEDFEKVGASHDLGSMQAGMILNDQEGEPQFKKLGDDTWEHVDLGVQLKDADIQDLYDAGDLVPDTIFDDDAAAAEEAFAEVDAVNFSGMTADEATSALEKMPEGQKVTVGGTVWTKGENDIWKNKDSDKGASSKSLSWMKNQIKIGAASEPEYSPLDENTVDPLDENAQKLIGVGDAPDENWLKKAKPGASFKYTPTNPNSPATVWTKTDIPEEWESTKGALLETPFLVDVSKQLDMGTMEITKDGKETPASKAAEGATKIREAAQAIGLPDLEPTDPLDGLEDLENEELVNALNAAEVGAKVHLGDHGATLTKLEDGKWESSITGKSLAVEDMSYLGPWSKGEKTEEEKTPLKFGDDGYFESPQEGDTVYASGSSSAITFSSGNWTLTDAEGEMSFTPAEMQEWYDEGILSQSPNVPEVSDISTVEEDNTAYTSILPESTTKVDLPELAEHLDAMADGDEIYEVAQSGKEYKYVKSGEGLFTVIQPNGLEIPNTPQDEIVATGQEFSSEFFVAADDSMDLNELSMDPSQDAKKAADSNAWEPGDKVGTIYDLLALKSGTNIHFVSGTGQTKIYTKLPGDMYYDVSSGNSYAAASLGGAVVNSDVKVLSLPPEVDPPVMKDGQVIPDFAALNSLPQGTKLSMIYQDKHLNFVVKNDKDVWAVPDDDPNWAGMEFSVGDMQPYFNSEQNMLKYVDPNASAPETPDPDKKKPSLWDGAPEISKTQLAEALKGLNEHSSFHVKYGLKDLPEGHPLKDESVQEQLKSAAMEANPDLKAKPAVVKYLKDALGIKDNSDDEDAPKIQIGSSDPKKVGVQGMDGGSYTQAQIQEAVDILEAYPGKLFKSELGKKGSPLGELDPTAILGGINKDKLAAKQQYIDFLKTKLVTQEPVSSKKIVSDMSELSALPAGVEVAWQSPSNPNYVDYYTKTSNDGWLDESGDTHGEELFQYALPKGLISITKQPDVVPTYAKVPDSVKQHSSGTPLVSSDLEMMSLNQISALPIGTKMQNLADDQHAVMGGLPGATYWDVFDGNGKYVGTWNDKAAHANLISGKWNETPKDQPKFNTNAEKGIAPGKYTTSAATTNPNAAYMIVKADGTGTYTSSKGDTIDISAEAVAKNYEVGMTMYHGMEDAPKPASTTKPAAKKPKSVENIPDGKYFAGDPSDTKTSYYEVDGDSVKQFTPATGVSSLTGVKVGQQPNTYWLEQSGFGASLEYPSYSGELNGIWTKGADGQWRRGEDVRDSSELYNLWYAKVVSHGYAEPKTLTKAKINTLFSQGKLTNQYGTSVLPAGYTGKTFFFGKETSVPSLLSAQKEISTAEISTSAELGALLKKNNVGWVQTNWMKWNTDNGFPTISGAKQSTERMMKALDDALAGVDTEIPESDASQYFQWNDLGEAVMPLELAAANPNLMYQDQKKAFIKQASKLIGDGKIIGQHVGTMDSYDTTAWINAFYAGDFKKMYDTEVVAAGQGGKVHASGYLHPGYGDNAGTHKIAWAAGVPGEVSALTKVDGDWTDISLADQVSAAEVNNYLIKAQMQNPTYLTIAEKRSWYIAHRMDNKKVVDQLSSLALLRKTNGDSEQSAPLQWSDDVQIAKAYDQTFEQQGPFPQNWTTKAAVAYYDDHVAKVPEFAKLESESAYSGGDLGKAEAVTKYFQAAKAKWDADQLIPVYTKKPQQTVSKSTHPIYQYTDQFGTEYFFKPSPQGDKYRSEAEHLGSELGKLFGYSTAESKLLELDGKYGQLQKDVGGVSDLMGVNYATLTSTQIADIGKEHLLDWFLDNDDTKGDNAKILANGHIVGIDKGRAFKHFGAWKGLSGDSSMNSNAHTIYSQLFDAIRAGKLDKADVDKAYLAIQRQAQKMEKISDETVSALLAEGMKNRKVWDVKYKIKGKNVTQDLAGLTAAVLDRKSKLSSDFEAMWAKVYQQAGFGDLPEAPKNPFGEAAHVGLDDAELHADLMKVNSHGKTTLVSGAHFQGGSVTMWNDHNADGTQNINAETFLAPKKQEEVLSWLQTHAVNADPSKMNPTGLESHDIYGSPFIAAAKTINHHAADGAYNQDKINEYEAAKGLLLQDLDAWTATLESNSSDGATYNFPSGQHVPMNQVDQYKLMLDHYAKQIDTIDKAKAEQTKTGILTQYQPIGLGKPPAVYAKDGKKITKLADGKMIFNDGENVEVHEWDSTWDNLIESEDWTPVSDKKEDAGGDSGVKVVYTTTHDQQGVMKDGKLTYTGAKLGSGVSGSEYEITLPTGEKIYFRNAAHTATLTSQRGKLSFRVPNISDPAQAQLSMSRIQAQLETMGIDASPADEASAELTYWREMYEVLAFRKHAAGSAYAKAKADLDKQRTAIGGSEENFLENMSEKLSIDAELAFWRGLWGKHFGQEKVDKLVAEQGYLPTYEAGDMDNGDIKTGKPSWMRFDVDVDELIATGTIPMSGASGNENVKNLAISGVALSTEERLRYYGKFIGGMSSSTDQGYGSAHGIFTRLKKASESRGMNFVYHPRALARTGTYSYNADNYGKPNLKSSQSPSDPKTAMTTFTSGSNETMIPHSASLLGDLEMVIFDNIADRNEAIQALKKKGWDMIRGLPIEDRLVMRQNINKAIEKVKASWK